MGRVVTQCRKQKGNCYEKAIVTTRCCLCCVCGGVFCGSCGCVLEDNVFCCALLDDLSLNALRGGFALGVGHRVSHPQHTYD